ncbi:MAG: 3'-5' exonuclease, partial [Rikenellaceae bacterium]
MRQESEYLGFPATFTIYETSDSRNLVKAIVKEMNLNEEKYKPKDIFARISLMKNSLTTPAIYANQPTLIADDVQAGRGEFSNIYRTYMKRCKQNGAMDFDDLLLYTNILFKEKPEVLRKYQERFEYILVDEYQDTNFSQYLIIKKLSELKKNICVVGDDAQSIYSFRGAKIENILRFQKDYPSAVVHKLEQNYRSTQTIVGAANSIIARNSKQLKKNVFSKNEEGDLIMLSRCESDREEAVTVCRDIDILHRSGVEYNDIAILYRTNSQSKSFEDQLRLRQIPYKIYGGMSFYQRAEIKNIIAYVRLIVNQHDDEATKRVINFPPRGIGATTIAKVEEYAKANERSIWDVLVSASPADLGVNAGIGKKIADFATLIKEFKAKKEEADVYELVYELVYKSGIVALYRDNPAPESQSSYENVEELINSLKAQVEATAKEEDAKLLADTWIQDVTLLTDMDEETGEKKEQKKEVTLMTIHSAKGLEFDTIYIVGVEEGTFPSARSVDDMNGLEEERRLFYVAVTRAIKRLRISFALKRYKWGSVTDTLPSRFLKEIDKKFIDEPQLLESSGRYIKEEEIVEKPARVLYKEDRTIRGGGLKSAPPAKREIMPTTPVPPKSNLKPVAQKSVFCDSRPDYETELKEGDRVAHNRFGFGMIQSMEPFNGDIKATVNFD